MPVTAPAPISVPDTYIAQAEVVSPGTISPQGLSREGSAHAPLLATASTPTAIKQKIKQQV